MKFLSIFLLSAGLLCCKADLVKNGKTTYTIVVPDQQDTGNRFAAKELSFFLKKASGAVLAALVLTPKKRNILSGLKPGRIFSVSAMPAHLLNC